MKKLLLIIFLIPAICSAQMKYTDGHFNSSGNYRVYEPTNLKPIGVILYFHGLGERSDTDLSLIERNEIPKLFKNGVEKPFIVICPQLSPSKNGWGSGEIIPMLNLIDAYARFYKVDKHVTGLSLGGMATYGAIATAFSYNGNKPGYFKTAAPVCGKSAITTAEPFKGTSIKIFHGTSDGTVGISEDYRILKMLQTAGVDVEYKWYIGSGHNIWGTAYNESTESYWRWLESKIGPVIVEPEPSQDTIRIKIITDRPYVIE